MMSLVTREIKSQGHIIEEGSASSAELLYLYKSAKRPGITSIAEIGFNLGFSAYAFLKSSPRVSVVSFDIGGHSYIPAAKAIIDRKFPGRHTLIYGDSTKTVPEFAKQHPGTAFDLIFIDGGHAYEVARADIQNMKSLAGAKTGVIIDDLTPWLPWGEGPTRAWIEAIQGGVIVQEELYKDGVRVNTIQPPGERSWALGHYRF